MSRLKEGPVQTFSIGFEGPDTHNELPYARILANHCHTHHHEFLVKPDIIEAVQELVHYADEPFAISSAIPTFLLSKAARQHVTVILTGDGGDEVFGGYEHYLYERWVATYRRLPVNTDLLLRGLGSMLGGRVDGVIGHLRSRVTRFVDNARRSLGQRRLGWTSGFSELEKQRLYTPAVYKSVCVSSTTSFLEEQVQFNRPFEPIVQQNCIDILLWLAELNADEGRPYDYGRFYRGALPITGLAVGRIPCWSFVQPENTRLAPSTPETSVASDSC